MTPEEMLEYIKTLESKIQALETQIKELTELAMAEHDDLK